MPYRVIAAMPPPSGVLPAQAATATLDVSISCIASTRLNLDEMLRVAGVIAA